MPTELRPQRQPFNRIRALLDAVLVLQARVCTLEERIAHLEGPATASEPTPQVTPRRRYRASSGPYYSLHSLVTAFGETKEIIDRSHDQRCRAKWFTLQNRLKRGIPPEAAMTLTRNGVRSYRGQAQIALHQF
jgi:hypothetical protein